MKKKSSPLSVLPMKHRVIVTSIIAFLAVNLALAQSPPDQGKGRKVAITWADVKTAMTPKEAKEFQERVNKLKEFGENVKLIPKGEEGRPEMEALYEERKKKLYEDFKKYRGFQGKTVTVYGDPLPTASQIITLVLIERRTRRGDGILDPHWQRQAGGGIVGLEKPPQNQPDPAGFTTPAGLPPVDMPPPDWVRRDGRCTPGRDGGPPWAGAVCYCPTSGLFGVNITCRWY